MHRHSMLFVRIFIFTFAFCLVSCVIDDQFNGDNFESDISESTIRTTVVAELVTVDYLWDTSNIKLDYEKDNRYVPSNNVITGVKVDSHGHIYVTVPRWKSGVPATLNKLVKHEGSYVLSPWPSWDFQSVGVPNKLQNCQSMIIDSKNNMWIIETGRRNFLDANASNVVNGPAGFFVVNIMSEEVLISYYFPDEVVPQNDSFINDIVLDEIRGFAYFTNTAGNGGIVVYNMNTNESRMFTGLSTQRNSSYDFCVDGDCYGTDGGVGTSPSDGIAINDDGTMLYWSPVQGEGLFALNTKFLHDFTLSNDFIESQVVLLGMKAGQCDGMVINGNTLWYGDIKKSAIASIGDIGRFTQNNSLLPSDSKIHPVSSENLRWVDTFAIDLSSRTNSSSPSFKSVFVTSNKLDLFFTNKMDFSGSGGANFRIVRLDLN